MMRLYIVQRAFTKYGILSIGILLIILIALVPMKPINLIKEVGNVKKQLSEVLDTAKKLQDNTGDHEYKDEPIVWININEKDSKEMFSVLRVFERLGFRQGSQFSQWDVLWSWGSAFRKNVVGHIKEIAPHQKVNHIPGSQHYQKKYVLATSFDIKSIPKAFKLPNQNLAFKRYAKEHPDYLWVQKHIEHRGIGIVKPEAVNLKTKKTFVQRYIDKPLLIDGKRFDIGMYVAVTSVDPLRVYMYDTDWVFRFCPENYHPFDPKNKKKYVIGDDLIPAFKIPMLQKLVLERGFSYKDALLSYLRTNGYNDTKVLNDFEDCIKEVFMKVQDKLVIDPSSHLSTRNFFDISRFDFIIDEDLNVYLMEANLSPDLALTFPDFKGHEIMHEQAVYSLLTMIGIGSYTQEHFMKSSNDSQHMMVSERNIHVYSDLCVSKLCENNCQDIYCNLCSGCQDDDFSLDLKHTVMEHNHRGDWRRMFPRVFKDPMEAKNWDPLKDPGFQNSTSKNKRMAVWIKGKCMRDNRWCF